MAQRSSLRLTLFRRLETFILEIVFLFFSAEMDASTHGVVIIFFASIFYAGICDHRVLNKTARIPRSKRQVVDQTHDLTMCIMVETNTTGVIYDYLRAAAAIELALTYVNEYIVPDPFFIKPQLVDLGKEAAESCSRRNHIVAEAMKLRDQGIDCSVYLGPGCGFGAEILTDVAAVWDIPIIACPAAELGLTANASEYDRVTRMSVTYTTITNVLLRFFESRNYTSPVFFQDFSVGFFQQMGVLMQETVKNRRSAMYYAGRFVPFNGTELSKKDISDMLNRASETSRDRVLVFQAPLHAHQATLIVLCADAKTVRRILIIAHDLHMTTGDYVFIGVELYTSDIWGSFTWEVQGDSFNLIARAAFQSLLILSLKLNVADDNDQLFWTEVKALSRSKFGYTFGEKEQVDPVVTHFYDAVVLYAQLVVDMSAQAGNMSFLSGLNLTNFVGGYTFYSPINGNVTFNDDGDRLSDYVLRSMNNVSFRHEVMFEFSSTSMGVTTLGNLEWVNGKPYPPNTPRCGFRHENPDCQPKPIQMKSGEVAAAVVIPLLFATLLVVGSYFVYRRVFSDQSDPFWWRILAHELEISASHGTTSRLKMAAPSIVVSKVESGLSGTGLEKQKTDVSSITKKSIAMSVTTSSVGTSAVYAGTSVTLLEFPDPKLRATSSLSGEATMLGRLQHSNVQKFIGVALNDTNLCEYIVGEFCQKGNLKNMIENDSLQLDWELKHSAIKDITNGMTYIHSSPVKSHGFLNDTNCLVDGRFIIKIAGFGLDSLRREKDLRPPAAEAIADTCDYSSLLWRAPEHLRRTMPPAGSQKGDVYSFAILLQQIVLRSEPFQRTSAEHRTKAENTVSAKDIVLEVKRGMTPPLRPLVPVSALSSDLHDLIESCWEEDPFLRPAFPKIKLVVTKIAGNSGDNIVDHLIRRMEQYAAGLESQVQAQMIQFMEERKRSSELLQFMLPKPVAEALVKGQQILPETYESTTVYFGDVNGFKEAVETSPSPFHTVGLLNNLYSTCDEVIALFDVFKVETVIDAYLIVSGLPVRNGKRHVEQIASMALSLRRNIALMKIKDGGAANFQLRVGIHTGPCVAGVIGLKMPRYCLFGDTVNTASRMETHGEAGKIHCSSVTRNMLEPMGDFIFMERGKMPIKGKGMMDTFWLVGKT